ICEDLGDLPPISEDCQTLDNAVTILSGSINPTFVVQSLHQQVLTFGTCRYFFTNLASSPLEYCWSSLSTQASAAGAACFPPVNPFVPRASAPRSTPSHRGRSGKRTFCSLCPWCRTLTQPPQREPLVSGSRLSKAVEMGRRAGKRTLFDSVNGFSYR
ncbi:hypothetical protein BC834DRAFT_833413, partial [Gloeopeniophorella convolvens]